MASPVCRSGRRAAAAATRYKGTVVGVKTYWANLDSWLEGVFAEKRAMAKKALRMIESLLLEDRNDQSGHFYTEMGNRFHVMGVAASDELMIDAAKAAGVDDKLDIAEDNSWDASIRASLDEAKSLVGPDTGTPVMAWGNQQHAIFGPVLSPAPTGEAAGRAFDAMVELVQNPAFWELKRNRGRGPEFGDVDENCDIPE